MIRECNREIYFNKMIIVSELIKSETIVSIFENKKAETVEVVVDCYNEKNEFIKDEQYLIKGEKYDLLMSANPDFAPNKLENEYREADLWHIIELIRSA